MADAKQEFLDAFYFENGPCCAGCDWWRSISVLVGDCTRSAPVSGADRWDMLGFQYVSLKPLAGHVVTGREHLCGDFKDDFDWTTLPLPYRKRVGAPVSANRAVPETEHHGTVAMGPDE